MSIDTFTLSALAVVTAVIVALAWGGFRSRKADRAAMDELRGRLDSVSAVSATPSDAARELCIALRCLYPAMQAGVDFSVSDSGDGATIREWPDALPKPSDAELAKALAECDRSKQVSRYREQRAFAYPSIGDQLDALYKARMGDTSDLQAIDQRIAAIKEQYPRSDVC